MTHSISITPTPRPNMAIVKFGNTLVSFPMAEDGTLFTGEEFSSNYDMEEHHIIFARYDPIEQSSLELYRFSLLNNASGQGTNMQEIFEAGFLQDFVNDMLVYKEQPSTSDSVI